MLQKKVIKDLFINNLSQGLQFGSRWFLNIVLLSILGGQLFGEFSFLYSISNLLATILPFGSYVFLMKETYSSEGGLGAYVTSIQIQFVFFVFLILLTTFLLCFVEYNDGYRVYIALFLGYIFSFNSLFFYYHKGFGNFVFELKINMFLTVLLLLLIGMIYYYPNIDIDVLFVTLISINLLISILSISFSKIVTFKELKTIFDWDVSKVIKGFQERKYYGLQDIVTASFSQGGMLLLPLLITDIVYGGYRAFLLIATPFSLLNLAFSQVLLNQIKGKTTELIGKTFHQLQLIFVILLLMALGLMYFFRAQILVYLVKQELTDENNFNFILICILILSSFLYAGYEMVLVALDKQKYRFLIMILGALTNLAAIFLLLPQYGLSGAIFTSTLSAIIVFIIICLVSEIYLSKNNTK